MRDWTVRQRIQASLATILLLMVVMGWVAYSRLNHVAREAEGVQRDAVPGMYYGAQIVRALYANYSLMDRDIFYEPDADDKDIASLLGEIRTTRNHLISLTQAYQAKAFMDEDRALFDVLTAQVNEYLREQDQFLTLIAAGRSAQAQDLLIHQVFEQFKRARNAASALEAFNKRMADEAVQRINDSVGAATTGILLSFLIAVVLAALCGYALLQGMTRPLGELLGAMDVMGQGDFSERLDADRRDEFGTLAGGFNRMVEDLTFLVGQVQRSVIRVNSSVAEFAAATRQQRAAATEVAATTTQISTASQEIATTSRELVNTMQEVSSVAEETQLLAGSGQEELVRMSATIQHVMDAASTINAKLAVLSEKATNINLVLTTITKVADQTNLLSVNAAIEAEKAGKAGHGFAVVAQEIRRLADQTESAAKDIARLVNDIRSAVSASVMSTDKFTDEVRRGMHTMEQVGQQLSLIIQHVQTLVPRFATVDAGVRAQLVGTEQITETLAQLRHTTRGTAESLDQSLMVVEDLNQVSGGLRESVARFTLPA